LLDELEATVKELEDLGWRDVRDRLLL